MTKRERIEAKIEANKQKIKKLQESNLDLRRQSYLISDKEQWYKEEKRMIRFGKDGRKECLVGIIYWPEYFLDEDTGNKIQIERCDIVSIDGVWQD